VFRHQGSLLGDAFAVRFPQPEPEGGGIHPAGTTGVPSGGPLPSTHCAWGPTYPATTVVHHITMHCTIIMITIIITSMLSFHCTIIIITETPCIMMSRSSSTCIRFRIGGRGRLRLHCSIHTSIIIL